MSLSSEFWSGLIVTQECSVLKLKFSASLEVTQEVRVEERDVPAANVHIHRLQFDGYRM